MKKRQNVFEKLSSKESIDKKLNYNIKILMATLGVIKKEDFGEYFLFKLFNQ